MTIIVDVVKMGIMAKPNQICLTYQKGLTGLPCGCGLVGVQLMIILCPDPE